MAVVQPVANEYQRALNVAARNKTRFEALSHHVFRGLPPFRQTPLVEWAVCKMHRDPLSPIYAKSDFTLKTFYTTDTHECALDIWDDVPNWRWIKRQQNVHPDWVYCPQCSRPFPKDARYWWYRDEKKGLFYLDACRDCKCTTSKRHRYRGPANALLTVVNRIN